MMAEATPSKPTVLGVIAGAIACVFLGLQIAQTVVTARISERSSRIEKQSEQNGKKTDTAIERADAAVTKADETHDLVNSGKGVALDLRVAELTRLYNATHLPEDLVMLNQAKLEAKEHREAMNRINEERRLRAGGKP